MKTKEITIKINVPVGYKYLAFQPFGELSLFKNKPKLGKGLGGEYWDLQDGEANLIENGEIMRANAHPDWKTRVIKI